MRGEFLFQPRDGRPGFGGVAEEIAAQKKSGDLVHRGGRDRLRIVDVGRKAVTVGCHLRFS
jgi:hypothetical protein